MSKILILGDGILGSELRHQTNWDIISRKLGTLNIEDYEKLLTILANYDTVINCIANTDSYSDDKIGHWNVNLKFPATLTDICNKLNLKLVHISTEFVYANNIKPPTEEDIPFPDRTWYAYTKLLADEYIKLKSSNFLICRELHKPNTFNYPQVWNVKTSGDKVEKIAQLIIQLINRNATGIFNVGTGDKSLKDLNPEGKLVDAPPYVPKDTRMNLDKLNSFLCLE